MKSQQTMAEAMKGVTKVSSFPIKLWKIREQLNLFFLGNDDDEPSNELTCNAKNYDGI